ncbi:MAG TPA: hypothetical protein DIT89_01295, partial [Planctomycetaceae bacterium]|nr:hypothetical protein [Planctomycetaceae bacterium]
MNSVTFPGFLEVEATVTIVIFGTEVPTCRFSHHAPDASGQWSVVSGQWSVVSDQLSVVSDQLSVVSCQEVP